jgi:hypothetical protein
MTDIIEELQSKFALSLPARNVDLTPQSSTYDNGKQQQRATTPQSANNRKNSTISKPLAPCTGYPSAFLNNCGTMSIFLEPNVVVDISVNRVIRVTCFGKFSATIGNDYNVSLSHELASVYQTDNCIYAAFRVGDVEKQVMIGESGIVLSMDNLEESYVLSKTLLKGNGLVPVQRRFFPPMKFDFTLKQFYTAANYGERYLPVCHKIVTRAHFTNIGNKKIVVINGIHIRVTQNDSVEITSQNRLMRFAPLTGDVQVKTPIIDVAVDASGKGSVIKGKKRVHASTSGLVVADGERVISIDAAGNVINSAT